MSADDLLAGPVDQIDVAHLAAEHRAACDEIHRLRAERDQLRRLLADILDDSDCRFDHHGGCQEHGFLWLDRGEVCPNHEARELLRE